MELHELTQRLNKIAIAEVEAQADKSVRDLKIPRWYFYIKVPAQLKRRLDDILYVVGIGKRIGVISAGYTNNNKAWTVYLVSKHIKLDPTKLEDVVRRALGDEEGPYAGPMDVDEFPGHKASQLESKITESVRALQEEKTYQKDLRSLHEDKNVVKIKGPRATFYHGGDAVGGILSPSKTISPEHMRKRSEKWYDKNFKAKYGSAKFESIQEKIDESKAYKQILTRFVGVQHGYYVFKDKKGDPFYLEPRLVGDFRNHLQPGMKAKLAYTQLLPGYANYALASVIHEDKIMEKPRLIEDAESDEVAFIIDKHPEAWRIFQQEGRFGTDPKSDAFYEDLFKYYLNIGEMPYGVAKARTGDPYEWIGMRLWNMMDHKLTGDEGPREPEVDEDVGMTGPSSNTAQPGQPSLTPKATINKAPGVANQNDSEAQYANNLEQVLGKKLTQASPAEIKQAAPKAKAMMGESIEFDRMVSLAGIGKYK